VRSTLPDTERVVVALRGVGRRPDPGSPSWCRGPVARAAVGVRPGVGPIWIAPADEPSCRRQTTAGAGPRCRPMEAAVMLWIVLMAALAVALVITFLAVRARPGGSARGPTGPSR